MLDIHEVWLVKEMSYIANYMEDKIENIESMIVCVIRCACMRNFRDDSIMFSISDNEYDRLYGIHIRFHISIDE